MSTGSRVNGKMSPTRVNGSLEGGGGGDPCSSLLLKRENDLSIDQTGLQGLLPECMRFAFADQDAEGLYREYYANEKRNDFSTLCKILIIINVLLIVLYSINYSNIKLPQLILLLLTLLIAFVIYVWITYKSHLITCKLWKILPFIVWLIFIAHLFCDLWMFSTPRQPSDSLALLLLYTYTIYVIYPLRLRICCLLATVISLIHTIFVLTITSNSLNQVSSWFNFPSKYPVE